MVKMNFSMRTPGPDYRQLLSRIINTLLNPEVYPFGCAVYMALATGAIWILLSLIG